MAREARKVNPDGYIHARDANEYQRLRDQARMWQSATEAVLDKVPAGVLIYRDDALLYANPAFLRWTGHPTLVIVAGRDDMVPDLPAKLPSEVKPVVIDGASHFFLDLYGEEAADLIAKFLKADQPATTK